MKAESRKKVILGWEGDKAVASPRRVLNGSLHFRGPDCWKLLEAVDQGRGQIRATVTREFY